MFRYVGLIICIVFTFVPFGLNSEMFSDAASEMAVSIGASADELSVIKIIFMAAQIAGLVLTPRLVRMKGVTVSLTAAVCCALLVNIGLYVSHTIIMSSMLWAINGFVLSIILISVNLLILDTCPRKQLPIFIAGALVFTTLLPMGMYSWLMAEILEHFSWQMFIVFQVWSYAIALIWLVVYPPSNRIFVAKPKSNHFIYLLSLSFFSLVTYLLMRGSYYNWLDNPIYLDLVILSAVLALAIVLFIMQRKQKTVTQQVLSKLNTNVYMYNAFLAGFAVMSSNVLCDSFLEKALHYNALVTGETKLPAVITMLLGMAVSVWVSNHKPALSDKIVPIGVLLILISSIKISFMPSYVSPEQLTIPLLLRGFGIGLLNVSVSIAVLMYFSREEQLEGISCFYLFRTVGGLIGGAFFSHFIHIESAQAINQVNSNVTAFSNTVMHYQATLNNAFLTNGHLPSQAMGSNYMSGVVQQQVMTLTLNNSLIMFVIAICILAPILIVGKKMAAKQKEAAEH
ncbi:MFS transporter [Photobacterium damselae subsp. damselae]|uniref:MFS transporter n=1 Tax=Photobacterium damselae TaxID=38293 RepID=UPI001EEF6F1E|nr:MFS transporter [Photobacterium damselae]UJZ93130.1 MFS transporter [Photobacterium damselae subsp. damselae]UJZ97113.1 MFS transporter [Photobacterium damselae subsp. damselae]